MFKPYSINFDLNSSELKVDHNKEAVLMALLFTFINLKCQFPKRKYRHQKYRGILVHIWQRYFMLLIKYEILIQRRIMEKRSVLLP